MSDARAAHLASAIDLRRLCALFRGSGSAIVLLDVRVGADGAPDLAGYLRGHVPGAHFVDIDRDLTGPAAAGTGARPLPQAAELSDRLRAWGVTATSTVFVYGDGSPAAAGRAWWVLRWAGLERVRILDGGLRAWVDAGGAVETGPTGSGAAEAAVLTPGSIGAADASDVERVVHDGVLLDSRPSEYFHRGSDPWSGHIEGAASASVFEDFDADGRLRDEQWLRGRYEALGVVPGTPTVTYCSGAVAAALQVFVLATIGIEAKLYVGALSEWVADPRRPVAP